MDNLINKKAEEAYKILNQSCVDIAELLCNDAYVEDDYAKKILKHLIKVQSNSGFIYGSLEGLEWKYINLVNDLKSQMQISDPKKYLKSALQNLDNLEGNMTVSEFAIHSRELNNVKQCIVNLLYEDVKY